MYRPAKTSLNGRTIDILNVIRSNASLTYQDAVNEIHDISDIPKVGDAIMGNPSLQNEFINALINRIGLVVTTSAIFNNPYSMLKKGVLEYGDSVEEIFIGLAKVTAYSANIAHKRELKRYAADVKSAFHVTNWRVMYPLTIEKEQLKRAFLSADGVERLITDLINQVFVAASYDEFLLFKYTLIKGVNEGMIISDPITATDAKDYAKRFRALSNDFTFLNSEYNYAGVRNNTPKEDQYIFMDAAFNADFDVDVLASAFNMDKADFMGKLLLIDDFTSFDNERWADIRAFGDAYSESEATGGAGAFVDEVTEAELANMAGVKAIIIDKDFFQFYDEVSEMEDQRIAAGLYWNFFYHRWMIASCSPFANAVAIVETDND